MSKNTESNLWGIHGGKTGDADTLFLKKNCVAYTCLKYWKKLRSEVETPITKS